MLANIMQNPCATQTLLCYLKSASNEPDPAAIWAILAADDDKTPAESPSATIAQALLQNTNTERTNNGSVICDEGHLDDDAASQGSVKD